MKILFADDDAVVRRTMGIHLQGRGYEVVTVESGGRAWEMIKSDQSLRMAILDWQMPGMSGTEICHRVREELHLIPFYLMLVTASGGKENLVKGLESGADDFLIKPFDKEILLTRVQVGLRSVEQQSRLVARIMELDATARQVMDFRRNLPVCAKCKRIRDDSQRWHRVAALVDCDLTGSFPALLCPECLG